VEHRLSKQRLESEAGVQDLDELRGLRLPTVSPTRGFLMPLGVALLVLSVVWHLWTEIADVPVYIVPGPLVVVRRLIGDIGFFAGHGAITLLHAMAGLTLGTAVAIGAATLMAHSRFLERSLLPLAVLVKVTPIVAVAPLLVIWFGFGSPPVVITAALITFFPVLVNTLTGLKSVNPGALDFFRSVHASRKETFFKLRAPSSLPYLFAAFRIAIPLSVIGAVVGELFGGDRGLGSVIFVAHHNLDMPTSFSAILVLAIMGISLTILPSYIERRALFWHESFIES
jgi:NitT/TauT family transport system permease protein